MSTQGVMNVFDRQAKRLQRNRTALTEDYQVFNYLKDEVFHYDAILCMIVIWLMFLIQVGFRLSDRVLDINRKFKMALDLGCGYGHASKHITKVL